MNLDEQLARIQSSLEAEERQGAANGLAEITKRQEERRKISDELSAIAREIRLLTARLSRLPTLPAIEPIRWAQSVLAYPNGRVMAVDTVLPAENAGIVRILLLGLTGAIHYDQYIAPGCIPSQQRMHELGLTSRRLHDAPSLSQIWPSLLEALQGTYIVSYGIADLRRILTKTAELHELASPTIIGECLLQRCLDYYQASGYVGLASLCRLAGYPLPEPPDCTAIDRARGQLHLLRAMARGSTGSDHTVPMDQTGGIDVEVGGTIRRREMGERA